VYGWLWHRLPGGPVARLGQLVLLFVLIALLLWYVVYPWASLHLPFDQPRLGASGAAMVRTVSSMVTPSASATGPASGSTAAPRK
jgi:hypothetical protein